MRKITIAIDGHSSTGKSTVAKQLADYLGYIFVDSGARLLLFLWILGLAFCYFRGFRGSPFAILVGLGFAFR